MVKIDEEVAKKVTTQSYGPKKVIDGVEILKGLYFNDDGGNFAEILRTKNGEVSGLEAPFEIKQLSMSVMVPKVIKAYHLHDKQDDLWFCSPYDRLLVNLHDVRKDSPTNGQHMRLILGGGNNMMIRIPKGVAHGVANVYDKRMTLIYATNQQFDPKNPDEHRLPWDYFGGKEWELTRG